MPNSDVMEREDVQERVRSVVNIDPPPSYSVLYFNDEETPALFVMMSLIKYFGYDNEAASEMTELVHNSGKQAVRSGLAKEVADHLRDLVVVDAREQKFPLKVEVELDATI